MKEEWANRLLPNACLAYNQKDACNDDIFKSLWCK